MLTSQMGFTACCCLHLSTDLLLLCDFLDRRIGDIAFCFKYQMVIGKIRRDRWFLGEVTAVQHML